MSTNAASNWSWKGLYQGLFWVFTPISIPIFIYQMYCYFKSDLLLGKVVLITGASSGLGEALAHACYKRGCKLILAARRKDELERVKKDLLNMHPTVPTHPPVVLELDLAQLDTLSTHVKTVLNIFGHIDILINNGGISNRGDAASTTLEVDQKVMLVNYFGTVALTKAVLPSMIQRQSGHIVVMSSVQGKIALPHRSAYGASKHALQAFCDSLRAEVSPHIKVTVINPGYVKTKLSLNALTGTGETYGAMDEATASGYSADYVAKKTVDAILLQSKEVTIAPLNARVAIMLRTIAPFLFFWIMAKRAK